MKYNKGFAPIIIALVIAGVLVLGGGAYYLNKSSSNKKEVKIENKNILSVDQNIPIPQKINIPAKNTETVPQKETVVKKDQIQWKWSKEKNIYYPNNFEIKKSLNPNYDPNSKNQPFENSLFIKMIAGDTFFASDGSPMSKCDKTSFEKIYGVFKYGVSGSYCLNGYNIGVGNLKNTPSIEQELKLFGDFVLKNS